MPAILNLTTGVVYVKSISGTLSTGAITMGGHLTFSPHNTYDIGTSDTSGRPRNIYVAGTATISGVTELNSTLNLNGQVLLNPVSSGILKLRDSAGTSFGRIQLGGETSSFPAIGRNAAGVEIKLADNSAFTTIKASAFTLATQQTYTATNVTTDRSFDADTVAVAELADVVGTLIADLRTAGLVL